MAAVAFDGHEHFEVPEEERVFIKPSARQSLFINLVENYKVFCQNANMIYAALNFDSELKIEYLVIFDTYVGDKHIVLWDAPYIYTNRAIPAYRYAVKTNQHAQYFKECIKNFKQIERDKFIEFLGSEYCGGLTLDHNSERYWRNPDNAHSLMEGISDLALLYIPKGFKNKHSIQQNLPSAGDLNKTINAARAKLGLPPI